MSDQYLFYRFQNEVKHYGFILTPDWPIGCNPNYIEVHYEEPDVYARFNIDGKSIKEIIDVIGGYVDETLGDYACQVFDHFMAEHG